MSKQIRLGIWGVASLVLLLSTAGCGGSSFIGRRYDNFTAYYNTFYNARKSFEEGVKAIDQNTEPVDRRYYISIFGSPGRATNAENFQNAIDKSADVLREHPNSKWVDDALLLIGKSYFYQGNHVGAEQKFREVIDLGTALEDEARLWLAHTLIASAAYEEAREHLLLSLNREDLSARWAPQLHLALGELYVKLGMLPEAAEELQAGVDEVRGNDLEARGWFLLGQVLESIERYDEAVAAYERVSRAHPRYELSYAADVSAIRVRGQHLDADGALQDLRRMERDDKNYANRYELAYIRGLIYQAQGRAADARRQFREILYDREAQIGDLRGRIHYALGELYATVEEDYLLAAAHFDTASTSMSNVPAQPNRQEQIYAPEAITDVQARAETFGTFAEARTNVARMDSLLELGSLGPEEFAERILEIRREMARELARQHRQAERRQAERGFQEAAARAGDYDEGPSQNEDTGTAGFLFHRDPIRVQEQRLSFIDRWGDRPHVPNWRRIEAVSAAIRSVESGSDAITETMRDVDAGVGEAPLPQLDYSNVPRDSLSRARMRAERALARYELGNVLFLSMSQPDSAAAWYRMVIEQDGQEEVAQRAYYALAEVHRSLGDSASARRIYEQVLRDYPGSDFAGRVREQLGIYQEVSADSLSAAFDQYDEAFRRWQRGLHADALERMIVLAAQYRGTEVAPKALLAAGQIYMEWADEDSLDFFAPLPVSVSDSVLARAGLLDVTIAPPADGAPALDTTAVMGTDGLQSGSPAGKTEPSLDPKDLMARERMLAQSEADATRPSGDPLLVPESVGGAGTALAADSVGDALTEPDSVGDARTPSAADSIADVRMPHAADSIADARMPLPADSIVDVRTPSAADSIVDARTPLAADSVAEAGVYALVDSVGGSGSYARADSVGDSGTQTPSDSVGFAGVSADSLQTPSDSKLHAPFASRDSLYLMTLYAGVRQLYPATPYADQATAMLDALRAELPSPLVYAGGTEASSSPGVTDSTLAIVDAASRDTSGAAWVMTDTAAAGPSQSAADSSDWASQISPDSAVAESPVPSDSAQWTAVASDTAAVEADSGNVADRTASTLNETAAADADQTAGPAIPQGDAALRGDGGIREELGGFTLVVGMNVKREPVEELVSKYAAKGFRTEVLVRTIGSTTIYQAAVGHFATASAAGAAMNINEASFDERPQVTPLRIDQEPATTNRE